MNVVILTGRLTKDVELKKTNDKAHCKFSLASNRAFQKDAVDFINCVAFGKTAELMNEYLAKGSKVCVHGRLQMNKYEVEGEKRVSYEVIVSTIEFLDNKKTEAHETEEDAQQDSDEFPF